MDLSLETIGDDVTRVVLVGRLDHKGAGEIDLKLSTVAGSRRKVVFDLEQVSFLASMGIRCLVMSAKTIKAKGGRSAILNPQPEVENILTMSSIDAIMPIFHDLDAATADVGA